MSRLDELIQEYCPNGVEYKALEELCEIVDYRGKTPKKVDKGIFLVTAKNIRKGYIDYEKSCEYIAQEDYEIVMRRGLPKIGDVLVTTEAPCGNVAQVDNENIALAQRVIKYSPKSIDLDSTYLKYVLLGKEFQNKIQKECTGGTVKGIKGSRLHKLTIPVPPLPIQEEIVRILDTFTELTAELQAELQARKKQYEYYRDFLIDNIEGFRGKLIDVLSQPITDGPHITPKLYESGVPFVSATAVYDGKVHLSDMKGYISKEFDKECAKKYKPQRDDVFMVKSGSTTGKVAFVDFDDDFNVWSPIAAMRVSNSNSPRFLYHLLQTRNIQTQVKEKMSQGSQPNLSMRALESFDVIIPPLEKQKEIVDFLDKIDEICNDANSGILAEIEARQKQYEYYRDKLLNFKPLS